MSEPIWLEYSSGGVPAGKIFKMTLDDLREIVESSPDIVGKNRLNEVCFIGLVSYFEGFSKDLFSSIINIVPELILNLNASGQDTMIDSTRVILYEKEISHKIGFLVAEKFDFGTAKKINALYKSLINITPFSKSEINKFNNILRDRNLFLHHGGIYTLTYLQQSQLTSSGDRDLAYRESLVLDKEYMEDIFQFFEEIMKKMSASVNKAIYSYCEEHKVTLTKEKKKAIDGLLWLE